MRLGHVAGTCTCGWAMWLGHVGPCPCDWAMWLGHAAGPCGGGGDRGSQTQRPPGCPPPAPPSPTPRRRRAPNVAASRLTSAHLGSPRRISAHLGSPRLTSPHLGSPRRTSAHLVASRRISAHLRSSQLLSPRRVAAPRRSRRRATNARTAAAPATRGSQREAEPVRRRSARTAAAPPPLACVASRRAAPPAGRFRDSSRKVPRSSPRRAAPTFAPRVLSAGGGTWPRTRRGEPRGAERSRVGRPPFFTAQLLRMDTPALASHVRAYRSTPPRPKLRRGWLHLPIEISRDRPRSAEIGRGWPGVGRGKLHVSRNPGSKPAPGSPVGHASDGSWTCPGQGSEPAAGSPG